MLKRLGWIGLTITLCVNSVNVVEAGPISEIIAFGDSLNDTGNAYLGSGGTIPPAPPYALGRFSNGPIWLDYFAAARGLDSPLPSLAGGNNYAVGGATSGAGYSLSNIPNLLTQVGGYLAKTGSTADPDALYVIWVGGNDFLNGETDPLVPVSNISTAVSTLAAAGANNFLVMNFVPLGDIPWSIDNLTAPERASLNGLVTQSNSELLDMLDSLAYAIGRAIHMGIPSSLLLNVQSDPLAYGFTNTTAGALNDGVLSASGYLFWDDLHPTTVGHALIASDALATIPEPSTGALSVLAVVCIGWYCRRRVSRAA